MEQIPDLPCPSCGSTQTLAKLRKKREVVKKRIAEQQRKRYPPPPPKQTGRTQILQSQIAGFGGGSLSLAPTDPTFSGDLIIAAPGWDDDDVGTIVMNDAVLDVCTDCGTFYATNAKRLGESILEETHRMDPLGALAEIGGTEVDSLG